jgi:hypothetical protein
VVRIEQVDHDLDGNELTPGTYAHIYQSDGELISRLDIVPI